MCQLLLSLYPKLYDSITVCRKRQTVTNCIVLHRFLLLALPCTPTLKCRFLSTCTAWIVPYALIELLCRRNPRAISYFLFKLVYIKENVFFFIRLVTPEEEKKEVIRLLPPVTIRLCNIYCAHGHLFSSFFQLIFLFSVCLLLLIIFAAFFNTLDVNLGYNFYHYFQLPRNI